MMSDLSMLNFPASQTHITDEFSEAMRSCLWSILDIHNVACKSPCIVNRIVGLFFNDFGETI